MGVALVRSFPLRELAMEFGGTVTGSGDVCIDRVVTPDDVAHDTDLSWAADRRWLARKRGDHGTVLCDAELARTLDAGSVWIHAAPRSAVARLLRRYAHAPEAIPSEIHETARVSSSAQIEPGVQIGARSEIGPGAVLLGGTLLGADVVIGAGSVIGQRGFGWATGPEGAEPIPHFGGVVIEDRVSIGALCTVDAGTLSPTVIGHDTKLDSHVHVGHNVVLGAHCLIAAQCGFAGSVRLGDGVQVGGQAGFADHVVVGSRARIAAKSGVIGDVPDGATYAGYPAVDRARWLRAMAASLRESNESRGDSE